jgi:hypothetical protein
MKPSHRKRLESYIRLLRLFEVELKSYHQVFDNDFYKINYIIKRERFSNDAQLKITLTIIKQSLWMFLKNESDSLKGILENYCRYFSVSDITIVRPLLFQTDGKRNKSLHNHIPPIEERVSFDLYMHEPKWVEMQ